MICYKSIFARFSHSFDFEFFNGILQPEAQVAMDRCAQRYPPGGEIRASRLANFTLYYDARLSVEEVP